ncbi:MAG: nuclear transport factor 2 family protein [Myxococcota bacterium]
MPSSLALPLAFVLLAALVVIDLPLVASCAGHAEARPTPSAAPFGGPRVDGPAALRATLRRLDRQLVAGAGPAFAAHYEAEAVLVLPGGRRHVGREALEAVGNAAPFRGLRDLSTEALDVTQGALEATTSARFRYVENGPPGGVPREVRGRRTSVWRRDATGRWRVVADVWTSAPTR